jgi:hypothetical protein
MAAGHHNGHLGRRSQHVCGAVGVDHRLTVGDGSGRAYGALVYPPGQRMGADHNVALRPLDERPSVVRAPRDDQHDCQMLSADLIARVFAACVAALDAEEAAAAEMAALARPMAA